MIKKVGYAMCLNAGITIFVLNSFARTLFLCSVSCLLAFSSAICSISSTLISGTVLWYRHVESEKVLDDWWHSAMDSYATNPIKRFHVNYSHESAPQPCTLLICFHLFNRICRLQDSSTNFIDFVVKSLIANMLSVFALYTHEQKIPY
jgi:hypothetical protein